MENEYKEDFTKTIDEKDYELVIKAIKEVHSKEAGWICGEIQKQELPNGKLRITVPLTKTNEKAR